MRRGDKALTSIKSIIKKPCYNLGLCRILFYGAVLQKLWAFGVDKFYYYQLLPKELWTPVGIFNFYPKDMMFSLAESHILLKLLCLFLFFSMIGFLTRISAFISFILALLLLGYPNNFGTVSNSTCLFLVTAFILIFSNMGATLSVDNLLRKKRELNKKDKEWNLIWDLCIIKLIITLTCLFYFTAGLQKLRVSGLDWFYSDHLSILMIDQRYPIGMYLSQFLTLNKILAFLSLLIQCLSFIPIIYSRAVLFFCMSFFLFHISIDTILGSHFSFHFRVLLFLIPWGWLLPQHSGSFKERPLRPLLMDQLKQGWTLHSSSIFIITSLISSFTIIMSLYAVITFKHLYPFSAVTMYAWIDKEPIKRKVIFITDKDNKKRQVERKEMFPLRYYGLFFHLKSLEKKEDGKKKIEEILLKIQKSQALFSPLGKFHNFNDIKKMSLEHCFWRTTKNYLSQPDKPDYCKAWIEQDF